MAKQKKAKTLNFKAIERKWQKAWADTKVFEARQGSDRKKYYVCGMFPYPSARFLHLGHMRNYTFTDVLSRYKRMKGFEVLHPMGFDAFGLPAENAAIKEKTHPKKYTEHSIKMMMKYMKEMGWSFDWTRAFATCSPNYYKWNQWLFLRMLEKGIAYRKEAPVNWCPSCSTVLANEEAAGGACWRCNSAVEVKLLAQWFLKITDYADELISGLEGLHWPERVKELQRNWIGRSEGTKVIFAVKGSKHSLEVFTTRADTLFGVSFVALSLQHSLVAGFVKGTKYASTYACFLKETSASEKLDVDKEKKGFFTGKYAIHPLTGAEIPIYAGTFVVADYGTGAVMGVPAHDARDFAFAKKHKIPIKEVVRLKEPVVIAIEKSLAEEFYKKAESFAKVVRKDGISYIYTERVDDIFELAKSSFNGAPWYIHSEGKVKKILLHSEKMNKVFDWGEPKQCDEAKKFGLKIGIKKEALDFDELREALVDDGVLINSDVFSGLNSADARGIITQALEKKGVGGIAVEYRLRDWLISRQRYWGTPIPIVYCDSCGVVPVPEKNLPVLLPDKVTFSGRGNPLLTSDSFVKTSCPMCAGTARRETDTMATFFDSSWYYLRYCSPNSHDIFDRKAVEYWMPIDQYVGGVEHAAAHLIYARFFTKFLRDIGWVTFDEPFKRLSNQGFVLAKGGEKMSKSKGDVVTTKEATENHGVDVARFFMLFVAGPDKEMEWDEHGVEGAVRFVNKFNYLFNRIGGDADALLEHKLNTMLKVVEQSYENFEFNKGIIAFMDFAAWLSEKERVPRFVLEAIVLAVAPIMPHLAEEWWHKLGRASLAAQEKWPSANESKIDIKFAVQETQIAKTLEDIRAIISMVAQRGGSAEKVYIYALPQEISIYSADMLSIKSGKRVFVFAVNDPKKYDPQGKSSKVKPGRPGIYVE